MNNEIRSRAIELAARPYTRFIVRDRTTDDEPIYIAMNPELPGCATQGDTSAEAAENLDEFRIAYIEHLLENQLSVPEPAWTPTATESNRVEIDVEPPCDKIGDNVDCGEDAQSEFAGVFYK